MSGGTQLKKSTFFKGVSENDDTLMPTLRRQAVPQKNYDRKMEERAAAEAAVGVAGAASGAEVGAIEAQ